MFINHTISDFPAGATSKGDNKMAIYDKAWLPGRRRRVILRRMIRMRLVAMAAGAMFAAAYAAAAQTNAAPAPAAAVSAAAAGEQWRARCIAERRSICGKIVRIFPNGLLVECGYTNLLRAPLTKSWLAPGSVTAVRAENLVETREPGALCAGTVLLTDPPRGKPHLYDYVIIAGYPTGEFTYTSVGTIQKTVRRFSANLDKAVKANLAAASSASRPPP